MDLCRERTMQNRNDSNRQVNNLHVNRATGVASGNWRWWRWRATGPDAGVCARELPELD